MSHEADFAWDIEKRGQRRSTGQRITEEAMATKSPEQLKFLRALHDEHFPPGPMGPKYRTDGGLRFQLEDIVFQVASDLLMGEQYFEEMARRLEEAGYLPVAYLEMIAKTFELRERCRTDRPSTASDG